MVATRAHSAVVSRAIAAVVLAALIGVFAAGQTAPPAQAQGRARENDFNGDGVEDLAVGVPWARIGDGWQSEGGVHVFYSPNGDQAVPDDQYFNRKTDGLGPFGPYATLLGWAIDTGDFNRDGYADLAITVAGFDHSDLEVNSGAVQVIYGSPRGLEPEGWPKAKLWTQASEGVKGEAEDSDSWGDALAVGDFDGDRYDDLAIGAPGEGLTERDRDEGSISVLYGTDRGLSPKDDEVWTQDTRGILDSSEPTDVMGYTLAAGDFDNDGADDLAAGVIKEDLARTSNVGAVNVLYGAVGRGLTRRGDMFFSQRTDGIPTPPEKFDYFGWTLAAGDFDGDAFDDLAIGAPGENLGGYEDVGQAIVLPGRASGLSTTERRVLHLRDMPDQGYHEYETEFSGALAAGDVDKDGKDELAVGSPGYDSGRGRVDILSGTGSGPSVVQSSMLTARSGGDPPYLNQADGFDGSFGSRLFFAGLDTVRGDDLVVAAPTATFKTDDEKIVSAGAVHIFYGRDGELAPGTERILHEFKSGVASRPERGEYFGYSLPGVNDNG